MTVKRRCAWIVAAGLIGVALTASPAVAATTGADLSIELQRRAARGASRLIAWFERTPTAERVVWGGLGACVLLGIGVILERTLKLRSRAVAPPDFLSRFLDRLHEGRLDGGRALDYCEMHPSPAARVALAAVRRWGRPAAELERAVDLAHRWESDRLRRNVGTLRRIAFLAPLLGLLGSLLVLERLLRGEGPTGPALADALGPLIAGVALGVVSMVLFDFLSTRVERLGEALDRIGAETIDAVAMTIVPSAPILTAVPPPPHLRLGEPIADRRPVVVVPISVREPHPRRLRDEPSIRT